MITLTSGEFWTLMVFAGIGAIGVVWRLLHFHTCNCGFRTYNCDKFIAHVKMSHDKKRR